VSSFPVVSLVGSRSLCPAGSRLAFRLGRSLASSGFGAAVGCAPGADLAFVRGWLSAPSSSAARLAVFAVGGASGRGFPSPRVSLPVLLSALAAGASVSWLAGGPLSVPLRRRLPARSDAAFRASSSFVLAVVSSPSSRGSFRSLRLAAAAGRVVLVFPVGFSPSLLPRLAARGCWVRSGFRGFPCFRWLAP